MTDLTPQQRELLRHMLGMGSSSPGYRNHFVASDTHKDAPTLLELERMGLIEVVPNRAGWIGRTRLYRATSAGRAAVMDET
ncbi:MAG: hypothetical protein CL489_06980 [Acidobacteria bacterium]|nr:hypothetical protein [Acidobacteriota bacterium]